MPNKSSCLRKDSLSAITGPLRSLWVRGKVCGLHDSESIRQNKAKFAGEAKKLLIIIAGKDKNYRLRKQRVWTDREYQEKVILSFFAGDDKAIKQVLKLVKNYRLTRECVAKANQKPRRSRHCILSSKKKESEMNSPPQIAVRCRYYKRQSALAVLDHAHYKRSGFTHSQNVKAELSHHNMGFYFHGANSCTEALELLCKKHKEIMGKKVRADNNILFEHIIIFSEAQYKKLESKFSPARINKAMIAKLKSYAMSIKAQFGFEPLGIDLHLDEGRYESSPNSKKKNFIRNIHAHVQFMNFDFSADKLLAPLRHLMKKGKDKNGKTLQLNPNFEKIQSIAFAHFKLWGFNRGISKNITGAEHLNKEAYVQQRLAVARRQSVILKEKIEKFGTLLADKNTELEEIVGRVKVLTSKKRKLEEEVAEYTSLKIELSEAIQQKSELALQRIRNKLKSLTKGPRLHR